MSTTIISHNGDGDQIPTATLALPSTATRRLPPPCWSPDETVALIDTYREKWYSLRRGNLRANHWQEIADEIASRCPVIPAKTSVQCRHKMEKLRKRYRGEIQRAAARVGRYTSSWVHFPILHSMEKGPTPPPSSSSSDEDEDIPKNSYNQRIKFPIYTNFNDIGVQNPNFNNPNPRFNHGGDGSSKFSRDGFSGRGEMGKRVVENSKEKKGDEVVAAIEAIGEVFMRTEKVKMDMVRKIEEMRMEMELKRTEMILESQQRVVESFVKAISDRSVKRAKRMSNSPER